MPKPEPGSVPIRLFDPPPAPPAAPGVAACSLVGPREAWTDERRAKDPRSTYPRCNRTWGHTGPHQRIRARDFRVMAEWEPSPACAPLSPPEGS